MYGGILITFVSGCNESGADGEGGGAIAHADTYLQWVSWLLDGTLSSGQIEPATFRLVVRSLNQLRHHVLRPPYGFVEFTRTTLPFS